MITIESTDDDDKDGQTGSSQQRDGLVRSADSATTTTQVSKQVKRKKTAEATQPFPEFVPLVKAFPSPRSIPYYTLSQIDVGVIPPMSGWYFPLFLDLDEMGQSQVDPCLLNPNTSQLVEIRRKLHYREQTQASAGKKMYIHLFYPRRAVTGIVQSINATMLTQPVMQEWLKKRAPDYWYMRRPRGLRMVNPLRLHKDALLWLYEVLEFQYTFRWDIYIRNFKFPISASVLGGPWWNKFRGYYKNRSAIVKSTALRLRQQADNLMKLGYLPGLIWYDPALFFFHDEVLQLLPMDFNRNSFLDAMELAYERDPARSYWVDHPHQHPFYRLGFHRVYTHEFTIPWRPVCDPRTGPSDTGYMAFVSGGTSGRYTHSTFHCDYRLEVRMQLGVAHFVNLESALVRSYTDSLIPSPIPLARPVPSDEAVTEYALLDENLDSRIAGLGTAALAESLPPTPISGSAGSSDGVGFFIGSEHASAVVPFVPVATTEAHASVQIPAQSAARPKSVGPLPSAESKPTSSSLPAVEAESKTTSPSLPAGEAESKPSPLPFVSRLAKVRPTGRIYDSE